MHANECICTLGETTYTYAVDRLGNALVTKCDTSNREIRIPLQLDGHDVTGLGDSSFAKLYNVTSITCPDGVRTMGQHAFEQCRSLKSIVFPASLESFDSGWIAGCNSLNDIVLPGGASSISKGLFGSHSIRRLHIGPGTRDLEIPRAQPLELEELVVDPDSLWLATDGVGLYSYDYDVLFAIVKSCESYRVADGCTRISPYAFAYRKQLKTVELPDSIQEIGDLAFLDSGITSFRAPASLRTIGNRAFMSCASLSEVLLNEGLRVIGEAAFARTDLAQVIAVPSTVENLGASVAGFPEELEEGKTTVCLQDDNDALFMDDASLVYQRTPQGLVLSDASCFNGTQAIIDSRTVRIGPAAFKNHRFVRHVVIPEGVTRIDDSAFANCMRLTRVDLPSSLEVMGDFAFFGSSISDVSIPARCENIGQRALDTTARRDTLVKGQLRHITRSIMKSAHVAQDNPAYYVKNGLLCRRLENDEAEAVLYVGPDIDVVIPDEVTRIGEYAFSGVTGVESLYLHDHVRSVGTAGLFPTVAFDRITIELAHPVDGHDTVDIELLRDESGMRIIRSALYRDVDAQLLLESHDATVPHYIDHFDRFRVMLDRLSDPIFLADWARASFERALRNNPRHACMVLANHDYVKGIDQLVALGFADSEDIREVVDSLAGSVRSVSSVARLLELKHQHFAGSTPSFEL